MALTLGMRQGELFGLQWDAINFDAKTVHVYQQAIELDNGMVVVKKLKTRSSVRTLQLTDGVIQALREHRVNLSKARLKAGLDENPIVFPSEEGTHLRRQSFRRWSWTPLLKSLKLQHRGFHHTRHTVATLLLIQGIEPQTVANILGHSSTAQLWKTYAKFVPGRDKVASDKIGAIMDKSDSA